MVCIRGVSTYLMCAPKKQSNIIIDVDDTPSQVFRSTYKNNSESIFRRFSHFYTYPFVKNFTEKIFKKVKHTLFANKEDCLATNAVYLPNIPYTKTLTIEQQWNPNHNILFVGKLSFPPNVEGINHFVSYIWPKVHAAHPDAGACGQLVQDFNTGQGAVAARLRQQRAVVTRRIIGVVVGKIDHQTRIFVRIFVFEVIGNGDDAVRFVIRFPCPKAVQQDKDTAHIDDFSMQGAVFCVLSKCCTPYAQPPSPLRFQNRKEHSYSL